MSAYHATMPARLTVRMLTWSKAMSGMGRLLCAVEGDARARLRSRRRGEVTMGILAMLVVGAVAGWLAALLVKGEGFGLLGNVAVGIVGAVLAGLILPQFG